MSSGPEHSSYFGTIEPRKKTAEEERVLVDGFIELLEVLKEREWMKAAVDEAGLMFESKIDGEGKPIGLRLVPKPPSTPQDLVDRV